MDCKEITILNFLELIEKDRDQTQRSISKILNISLGNTNAMVKGLVDSGYIEVHQNNKNRVNYVMTEKGDSEKVKLIYEYLEYSISYCRNINNRILKILNELCRENIHYLAFFGVGKITEQTLVLLQQTPLELVAVFDQNLAGQIFFGVTVLSPSKLSSITYDKLLITELTDIKYINQITNELKIPRNKWITIK